jgi:signal transduction histidine kinase
MSKFLVDILTTLPKRSSHERVRPGPFRREFLRHITKVHKDAFCLLYLVEPGGTTTVKLVLSHASIRSSQETPYPIPRRYEIPRKLITPTIDTNEIIAAFGIGGWLRKIDKSDYHCHVCSLQGPQYSSLYKDEFSERDYGLIGIVCVFVPQQVTLSDEQRVALMFAERLLVGDICNSRLERSAIATSEALKMIRDQGHDILARIETVCELFRNFTQSKFCFAFKIDGPSRDYLGSTGAPADRAMRMADEIMTTEFFLGAIRRGRIEHGVPEVKNRRQESTLGDLSWLTAPCLIDAINMSSKTKDKKSVKTTFLMFVCLGRSDTEYLGRGYSPTDLRIAEILCSIFSWHIPATVTSKYMRAIPEAFAGGVAQHREESEASRKLSTQETEDPIEFLSQAAARLELKIRTIIQANDIDGNAEPEMFANQTIGEELQGLIIKELRKLQRSGEYDSPAALDLHGEHYLAWSIPTEFNPHRFLLLGTGTSVIPQYFYQILIAFVDNYYLYLQGKDFYTQQISTLAQIRHAVRGPITAASSILNLLASRYARYASAPGKLTQLMELPSMRAGIPDALYWTNEAYLIVDSPRYLLGAAKPEDVRWGSVDVLNVINTVLNAMIGEMSRRELRSFITIDGRPIDRFADDASFFVPADRMLIWTVIFNLIDNAVKYSHAGRRIGIYLERLEKHNKWRFSVENFGVPIYPDEKRIIFQPWVRSRMKDVGRRRPGTGLGLAICQAILEAHGLVKGSFDCESERASKSSKINRTVFFFELGLKGHASNEERHGQGANANNTH